MTEVALREYLERLIHEADRRYEQRFAAMALALDKADVALREYKIVSNEWRDALKDVNNLMATRVELERVDRVVRDLRQTTASRDELEKIDGAVRDLQRAKANLDGRLLVLSGSVSVLVSVLLWAFTRFLQQP